MKRLLITMGIISSLTIGIIWATLHYLDFYTRKGKTVLVPNLIGKTEAEIPILLKDHLSYKVSDSIYDKQKPKGIILDQNPKPFVEVKQGRIVSIIVNRKQAPFIAVPNIKDKSISQATKSLQTAGFFVGKIDTVKDVFPVVLKIKYQQKELNADTSLPDGSLIDLVVGTGE